MAFKTLSAAASMKNLIIDAEDRLYEFNQLTANNIALLPALNLIQLI
jgi:hypothetical protein